jgi:hypothetical protein
VVELNADPGQTLTTTIRVRDVTSGSLLVHGTVDDFGAGSNEEGQPHILTGDTGANRFSLKYWVTGVPDLSLGAGELKATTVSIHVPTNAEPGGHYGVVRFTGVPPNLQGSGVALSASVGTLILLKVSGNITENLNMDTFATGHTAKDGTFSSQSFFEHGPVDFLVRLHNTGSVHEKAKGTITIKNVLGKKVAEVPVNTSGGNVLPDSFRRFPETWNQKQLFGHYTASLALTYSNNKSLTATTGFWVIPWKLVLLVVVGLVVLVWLLRLALRKYNEHIIASARRR